MIRRVRLHPSQTGNILKIVAMAGLCWGLIFLALRWGGVL